MGTLASLQEECTETEFRLRPVAFTDEAEITDALSRRSVATMLSSVPHPYPAGAARDWLGDSDKNASEGHRVRAIDVGGRLAGIVALTPHPDSGGLELGYWVAPAFWGRGLATRAASQLAADIVPLTDAPGLFARATADNPASQRVLGKLGFEPVGVAERHFASRNAMARCHLFWRDRRKPGFTLETRRLVLTLPYAADIPRLVSFLDDIEVAKETARVPHPYRRSDAEAFIAGQVTGADQVFAIRLKDEDGALIGGSGFGKGPEGTYELGYWLGRPYWGKGFATEAARAVIDLLFSSTEVGELHASARVMNGASRRVLEKCGFQHWGTGLSRSRALGGSVPVDRFRLDRGTWRSILAWRPAIRHEPQARPASAGATP